MIIALLLVIFAHVFVLAKLNFLPFPELFIYPYLTNNGLVPYKEILDQHFPGLMFLPVNLDNLGFNSPAGARIWQFALVAVTHILILAVSQRFFKSRFWQFMPNILFLIWHPLLEGWMLWIDSFLAIFYLLVFYFLDKANLNDNGKHFILAGIFVGIATLFKQVAIPMAIALALFLLINKKSEGFKLFIIGYFPIPILMVVYFIFQGTFNDFFYWTVIYNLTTFAEFGRKFATVSELVRAGFVFGFPFVLVFLLKLKKATLLVVFLLASLPAAYARFDFLHLQPALPFCVILTALFFSKIKNKKVVLFLTTFYMLVTFIFLKNFYIGTIGNKVYFYEEDILAVSEKVKGITSRGESIFLFGVTPNIYQMTQTLPAGNLFVFQFPWFMMDVNDRILEGVKKDKPNVVLMDETMIVAGQMLIIYSSEIYEYITNNYELTDRVGTIGIFTRK